MSKRSLVIAGSALLPAGLAAAAVAIVRDESLPLMLGALVLIIAGLAVLTRANPDAKTNYD